MAKGKKCGCKVKADIPTNPNKVRHSKLFPKKGNPFLGAI